MDKNGHLHVAHNRHYGTLYLCQERLHIQYIQYPSAVSGPSYWCFALSTGSFHGHT